MRATIRIGGALGLLLVLAPVWAQDDAPDKKFHWDLDAQARLRAEWRQDYDLDESVQDDESFLLSRFRVGVGLGIEENFRFYFQVQDSRTFGEEASTASDEQNVDMHQGYVDLWRQRPKGWSARLGRQEWIYGAERLIGAFGWSNIGRAFDGGQVRYQGEQWRIDILGAALRKDLTTTGTSGSELYGAYFTCNKRAPSVVEGYWLEFQDRVVTAGEAGQVGATRIDTLGGRTVQHFAGFEIEAEAAYEAGRQSGADMRAWAAALNVAYAIGVSLVTTPFAGYDFATGDEDATDGVRHEFFNFFPTNHKHYGYADLFGWRNLRSYYGGVRLQEGKHWGQAKFHRFSLETAGGPWRNAAGAVLGYDPTGQSGRSVGWEVDLNYRYYFTRKGSVEAGISRFEPGHFARATRGPDPTNWAYLMFVINAAHKS